MAKEIETLHKIINTLYNESENAQYTIFPNEYETCCENRAITHIDRLRKIHKWYERIYNYAVKVSKENEQLKTEINQLRLNPPKPISNAGRRPKFNNEQKKQILNMYNVEKMSMSKIAEIMKCSKGLVHKIINEQNK